MDMWMNRMGSGGLGVNATKRLGSVVFVTKLVLSAACLVFFGLAPNASAQLYTGSVSGTVTDPSAAAVPSAKVTLVDVDKAAATGTLFNLPKASVTVIRGKLSTANAK